MKLSKITFLLLFILTSCGNKDHSLSGAGATFPAPYYNVLLKSFHKESGIKASYGAIGSGGGIRSLTDKTVDFGATDLFLSDKDMQKLGQDIVHLPTCIGGVVMTYNLKGMSNLRLTAENISDMYRGVITHWDDASIAQHNPDLNLPHSPIIPVFRSDGSGTTAVFSEYMSKVNEDWNTEIGTGKSLNFPKGLAAKGNPGVAGVIAETDGAVGYVGSEFAFALDMPTALLQNSSGNFIEATNASISLAADVEIPADTRVSITNSPHADAYPIATFTWIIAYKNQSYHSRTKAHTEALLSLFRYIISPKGQEMAVRTHYAPLSDMAIEKAGMVIDEMEYAGRSHINSLFND